MKKLLAATAAACLAAPALGDVSVNVTPIAGTANFLGTNGNGQVSGYTYQMLDGLGGAAGGTEAWDNLFSTTPGTAAFPVTYAFVDWTSTTNTVGWSDDVGGASGEVVNHLHYLYLNTTETSDHRIEIWTNGGAPVQTTQFASYNAGNLARVIDLPSMPSGSSAFLVTVSFTSLTLGANNWVSFYDGITGGGGAEASTFWGSGGIPGIGTSVKGVGLQYTAFPTGYFYTPLLAYPSYAGYFYFGPSTFVAGNINMALGVPGPGAIGVLAAAGLVSLRRRRRK